MKRGNPDNWYKAHGMKRGSERHAHKNGRWGSNVFASRKQRHVMYLAGLSTEGLAREECTKIIAYLKAHNNVPTKAMLEKFGLNRKPRTDPPLPPTPVTWGAEIEPDPWWEDDVLGEGWEDEEDIYEPSEGEGEGGGGLDESLETEQEEMGDEEEDSF